MNFTRLSLYSGQHERTVTLTKSDGHDDYLLKIATDTLKKGGHFIFENEAGFRSVPSITSFRLGQTDSPIETEDPRYFSKVSSLDGEVAHSIA